MTDHEKLPISVEELKKQKQALRNLNTQIWTIIEMTGGVREILWGKNYQKDAILATKVEVLWRNLFKIEFIFPEYNLWVEKLEHVSSVQMQLAINQWCYMAYGLAIKNDDANSPLSYETFLLNIDRAWYVKDRRNFSKPAIPGEKAYLIFKVHPFRRFKGTYFIKAELIKDKDTFIDGEVMCGMEEKYLFTEEVNNYKDLSVKDPLPNTMVGNVRARFEANEDIKNTMSMTDMPEDKKNNENKDSEK